MATVTTPIPTQNVAIAKITWRPVKKDERTFDPEFALKLADSIHTDGLIHPITVMDDPDKPGHFIGVLGRHRSYACDKGLKWKEIPAVVLTTATEDDLKSMTIAENLWRNPLNKNQRAKAVADWHRIYEAKVASIKAALAAKKQAAKAAKVEDPQSDGAPAAEPSAQAHGESDLSAQVQLGPEDSATPVAEAAEPEPEAPTNFAAEVSAATGMSKTAVKRSLKIGNAFTEDQVRILDDNGVSQDLAETMADLPQEQRDDAVSLIASGMDPVEAIGEATKQDQIKTAAGHVRETKKGKPSQKGKEEKEEISDDDWIAQQCGDRMAMMPEATQPTFRQHALLYRRTRELRKHFATKIEPFMTQARKDGIKYGMSGIINRMLGVEHPKAWLMCGDCKGVGCTKCSKLGFLVGFIGNKK